MGMKSYDTRSKEQSSYCTGGLHGLVLSVPGLQNSITGETVVKILSKEQEGDQSQFLLYLRRPNYVPIIFKAP